MTTATHSLDTSSGSTTVAELLARNGASSGRPPHRRGTPVPSGHGSLNGTLPAIAPVEPEIPQQYRYDEQTVTALLAAQPAEPQSTASATKHTGRRIAGLAFAGAVLVGGWALASAQPQPADAPTAAGPVPASSPGVAVADGHTGALETIGAQSAALVVNSAPSATAPAQPENTPDQGSFSGTLPATTKAKAPAATTTQPAAKPQQARSAPNWPSYYYDFAKYAGGANDRHGHDNGGKHRKGH